MYLCNTQIQWLQYTRFILLLHLGGRNSYLGDYGAELCNDKNIKNRGHYTTTSSRAATSTCIILPNYFVDDFSNSNSGQCGTEIAVNHDSLKFSEEHYVLEGGGLHHLPPLKSKTKPLLADLVSSNFFGTQNYLGTKIFGTKNLWAKVTVAFVFKVSVCLSDILLGNTFNLIIFHFQKSFGHN